MKYLRTADERFENLPGYDFEPHYLNVPDGEGGSLRMHYLDEGPRDGPIFLCMHGEPSWCYLYRKMIGPLVDAGFRVLAPDLIGFGRSDKLTERADYTFQAHVDWMTSWLHQIGANDITFFGQDWGGIIGLRLVGENPDLFARVVVGNTGLPTGEGTPTDAFMAWRKFSQEAPQFPIGGIINGGCVSDLPEDIIAAYDAPFPDDSYKAGARKFPILVPISADDPAVPANLKCWEVFRSWEKPWLTTFSDSDPVTKGGEIPIQQRIPGCQGQPHTIIKNAGHFLQEDKGEELAQVIIEFVNQ